MTSAASDARVWRWTLDGLADDRPSVIDTLSRASGTSANRRVTTSAEIAPEDAALPMPEGSAIYALGEVCLTCWSQCFGCPTCGRIRCLHCDPLEVNPEREPDCHAE